MRIIAWLVASLIGSTLFGQSLSLSATKVPIWAGAIKPKLVGDYVVVGERSRFVESFGMYINVETGRTPVDFEIEAEQPGTLEFGELTKVDSKTWLLIGNGKYRITATIYDSPRERARLVVELGPPPPSLVVSSSTTEISILQNAKAELRPVQVSGGKPPYRFSVSVLPSGLSLQVDGSIAGSPTVLGRTTSVLTVTDDAGQVGKATVDFVVVDVPKPPPVPPDAFENIGQRVAEWSMGLPKRKVVAAGYRACADRLENDPSHTINSSIDLMMAERTKVLTAEELQQYKTLLDPLNTDLKKRWPLQRSVLADYFVCIALGLEAGQ